MGSWSGMLSSAKRRLSGARRLLGEVVRFKRLPMESAFLAYYHKKLSSKSESLSGPGSSLTQTSVMRRELPRLLRELHVRCLLDAPCGDFHWMSNTRLDLDHYIGVDIVSELVAQNQAKYGNSSRHFLHLDITEAELPKVDLVLCRDCLVHLSSHDVVRAIRNFRRSGSTYLLTTTFPGRQENVDIVAGDWRPLNLEAAPFCLGKPLKLINEGDTELDGEFSDKSLGLWRLEEIGL